MALVDTHGKCMASVYMEISCIIFQSRGIHAKQDKMWSDISGIASPALLPPHAVIGLVVKDPRLKLPPKKIKLYPEPKGNLVG